MPFGISSASKVLQKRNQDTFGDIPGVHIIADDIIIATSEAKHDETVRRVMDQSREKQVRFSKDKLQFRVNQVCYVGNIVSAEGLKPDEEKIKAITQMPGPRDKKARQGLLGVVKYLAQYIPHESDITAPLRQLLRDNTEWLWQPQHNRPLQSIKEALTSKPVLHFYDPQKTVKIQADALQNGLGACIMQEGYAIAYASRMMSSAETNYTQIEKEVPAIAYACDKFHPYIYGQHVHVDTDHRPLEAIMKKPMARAPARLQQMMLKLQSYALTVTYVPGKDLKLPDTLSHASLDEKPSKAEQEATDDMEVMVHSLVANLPVTALKMEEIRGATDCDHALQMLKHMLQQGWPDHKYAVPPQVKQYWVLRDEIMATHGLLFLGDRLIIPTALQADMLQHIHEGHLGAEKCKSHARGGHVLAMHGR